MNRMAPTISMAETLLAGSLAGILVYEGDSGNSSVYSNACITRMNSKARVPGWRSSSGLLFATGAEPGRKDMSDAALRFTFQSLNSKRTGDDGILQPQGYANIC
jgi:hypothetical protein